MDDTLHSLALILVGFLMLTVQSSLVSVFSVPPLAPNLILPIVIMLGVSQEVHVVRGAFVSFVLGYLLDGFCGNLMSLQTFVLVSTFMLARVAGLRLFLRGPAFQVALTFVVAILNGVAILALRAIFATPPNVPLNDLWPLAGTLIGTATTTAILTPPIFRGVNALDAMVRRRREDAPQP